MRRYTVHVGEKEYRIDVQELAADRFRVIVGGREYEVRLDEDEDLAEAAITPEIVPVAPSAIPPRDRPPEPEELPPIPATPPPAFAPRPVLGNSDLSNAIVAPMPGTIVSVAVTPGATVAQGDPLLVLEAMKMKNTIKSPRDGTVAEVPVQPGVSVQYGTVLVRFREG